MRARRLEAHFARPHEQQDRRRRECAIWRDALARGAARPRSRSSRLSKNKIGDEVSALTWPRALGAARAPRGSRIWPPRSSRWGDEDAPARLSDALVPLARRHRSTARLALTTRSATKGCATWPTPSARRGRPAFRPPGGSRCSGSTSTPRATPPSKRWSSRSSSPRWLDGAFLVAHLAVRRPLDCSRLGWGDEEARRLAAALEHATLALGRGEKLALEKLDLARAEAKPTRSATRLRPTPARAPRARRRRPGARKLEASTATRSATRGCATPARRRLGRAPARLPPSRDSIDDGHPRRQAKMREARGLRGELGAATRASVSRRSICGAPRARRSVLVLQQIGVGAPPVPSRAARARARQSDLTATPRGAAAPVGTRSRQRAG